MRQSRSLSESPFHLPPPEGSAPSRRAQRIRDSARAASSRELRAERAGGRAHVSEVDAALGAVGGEGVDPGAGGHGLDSEERDQGLVEPGKIVERRRVEVRHRRWRLPRPGRPAQK